MSDPTRPHIPIGQDTQPTTPLEAEQNAAAQEFGQEQKKDTSLMEVRIASPYVTYFDDRAFSVSADNPSGPFDILPGHHNFISLLTACVMVVRSKSGEEQKIKISGGIMHVKADKVIVFLDV